MYFRNTKNRKNHSQSFLRSRSVQLMQHTPSGDENTNLYEHTYSEELPDTSADILSPVVEGFTNGLQPVNKDYRELFTVAVWLNDTDSVSRCCVIQPEVASATCTVALSYYELLLSCKNIVSQRHPDAPECNISKANVVAQVSGRMAPYVIQEAGLRNLCKWGFVNACKSKILFLHTGNDGPQVLTLTRSATAMLKPYMPSDTACVYDDAMSCYKITVTPEQGDENSEANKNTCLVLYGDGSIRLQGTPSKTLRPCMSFRTALLRVSQSRVWYRFLRQLAVLDVNEAGFRN